MQPDRYYFILTGDHVSRNRLVQNFGDGSPRVFIHAGDVFLDADELQVGFEDFGGAESLLRSLQGAMRASGLPCDGITIGSCHRQVPNGPLQKSVRATASISFGAMITAAPTVIIEGQEQPKPRPLPIRILDLLSLGGQEVQALHLMMIKGEPDWRDLHVIIEILHKLGYPEDEEHQKEVKRIKWTAGNWQTLGVEARHFDQGHHAPSNPPTLDEARKTILGLVRSWFDKTAPQ